MKNYLLMSVQIALICASCSKSDNNDEEATNQNGQDTIIVLVGDVVNSHNDSIASEVTTDTFASKPVSTKTQNHRTETKPTKRYDSVKEDTTIPNDLTQVEPLEVPSDTISYNDSELISEATPQSVNPENGITIYSFPPRAKVYLDNKYVGISPCAVELDDENHTLVIDKHGYYKVDEIVNFEGKKYLVYNLVKIDERTRNFYDPKTDD